LGIYREKRISAFVPQVKQAQMYRTYKPHILAGYPSSLRLLAETLQREGRPFPAPRIVVSGGEVLLPTTRALLSQVFRTRVRDAYGIEEMGHIAWECPVGGGYHLSADTGIHEIMNGDRPVAPGEEGDLVATSLFSRSIPLIRYRVGDRVALEPDPCPCGCSFPRIRRIVGRADDLLQRPSGEWVHPVVAACGVVEQPGVERFRIVQLGPGEFQVDLVMKQPLPDALCASIEEHFRRHLGAREVIIRRKDEIPPESSGKHRHILYRSRREGGNSGLAADGPA
jgi:phenylacetate-CoA ligase